MDAKVARRAAFLARAASGSLDGGSANKKTLRSQRRAGLPEGLRTENEIPRQTEGGEQTTNRQPWRAALFSDLDSANAVERTRAVLLVAGLAGRDHRVKGFDLGLAVGLRLEGVVQGV